MISTTILVFLFVCFEESLIISYISMSSSFRLAIEFMLFLKVSSLMSILSSLNSSLSKNPCFGLVTTIASRLELVSLGSSSSSSSSSHKQHYMFLIGLHSMSLSFQNHHKNHGGLEMSHQTYLE